MDKRLSESHQVTTLWYTRCPIPTAAGIAVQTGMLAEEFAPDGIDVRSLSASGSRRVYESHFDHTQPDSFRHGGNVPPIWSRSRGADTAVVALSWTDEYQSIIALPESGIAAPADLKGRRIGLPARVNDQIDFYRSMCLRGTLHALALAGFGERDVQLIEIPVEENYIGATSRSQTGQLWSGAHRARRSRAEAFALVRGQIDAVYTSGAMGLFLRDFLGARDVVDLGFHPDPGVRCNNDQPTVLTVSGPLARERPDLVARFLEQCRRAGDWARTHRGEALQIVANEANAAFEWAETAYGASFHLSLEVGLDARWIEGLRAQKDFLLRHGFIERDFDLDAWIDPRPLKMAVASGGSPTGAP